MEIPKVSVIIPCYNSENYIKKCLESVLYQSYKNIEIICIDDGSTDDTIEILKKYSERVKIIEQSHRGIVAAKKNGIKNAKGKYVLFLDSDDWIAQGLVSDCVDYIERYEVESVYFGYCLMKGNAESKCIPKLKKGIYDNQFICNNLYDTNKCEKNFNWAQWAYLVEKEKIEECLNAIKDGIIIYEDIACMWMYLVNSTKIYVTDKVYYYYRVHSDSTGRKMNTRALQSVDLVYNYLIEAISNHAYKKTIERQLKYMMFDIMQGTTCFSNERQEFYMFPYEMIDKGKDIILYGAGYVGKSYYRQLQENNYCNVILWCDKNWKKMKNDRYKIEDIKEIEHVKFDYILICNIHEQVAETIKRNLLKEYSYIDDKQIIVYEPRRLSRFVDLD